MQNKSVTNYIWKEEKDNHNYKDDCDGYVNNIDDKLFYFPFTQASFYGSWQTAQGRDAKKFFAIETTDSNGEQGEGGRKVACMQVITYPLLRGKKYMYAPYGPVIYNKNLLADDSFLKSLKSKLTEIARLNNAVFVRLDFSYPELVYRQDLQPNELNEPKTNLVTAVNTLEKFFKPAPEFTYHSAYFQPRYEWFLSLKEEEEEILKKMHEKTRYSIRLSQRKGVTTRIIEAKDLNMYFEEFYELMKGTASRNEFSLHNKKYYQMIFENITENGSANSSEPNKSYLSIAEYGDAAKKTILSMDLVIVYAGIAHYIFGASSNEERNRMPAHAAQWAAILHAKRLGLQFYNFGGISLTDGGENGTEAFSKVHIYKGWEGLTSFKRKFGGQTVLHLDFFDIVVEPMWYHLYNFRKWLKSLF